MNTILSFVSSKKVMTTLLLLLSALSFSQVVTDIFPTRVTTSSNITIIGTGFSSGDQNNITITGISINSKEFVSATEMRFKVTRTGSSTTGQLSVGVSGYSYTVPDRNIEYVQPTSKTVSSNSQNRVREVYTSWDQNGNGENFWKSGDFLSSNTSTWPNDSHELLGFKMTYGSVDYIFSTGVDDTMLESKLTSLGVDGVNVIYMAQEFKAYSTNGVSGTPNSNNFIGMADLIDGYSGSINFNDAVRKTVYDVIIDGDNGLDLGTGIANFNNDADIRFYSGNGSEGTADDGIPDLIITQMAQPGGTDVYYYADVEGNVVGKPIKVAFQNYDSLRLFEWYVDFYKMNTSTNFDASLSTGNGFSSGGHRGYRMAAFQLDDFQIDDTNILLIDNINMGAGGSSDMSFMAYNQSAFAIKSPIIDKSPVSRFICRLPSPSDSSLTFSVLGSVDEPTGSTSEDIKYEWFKNHTSLSETTSSYTINGSLDVSDIENVTYRVRVSNDFGAVDLPFTISEGGTPAYWNGTTWELPSVYTLNSITVDDRDRSLIFSEHYSKSSDLVGCDCTVTAGKDVVIPSDSSITLFNSLTVEDEIPATTVDGETTELIPAGTFTLEDDASLVQINDVENSGNIIKKRTVDGTTLNGNDYIYWSSPVEDAPFSSIPGNLMYEWHTNDSNNITGTTGNWASASGTMSVGRGYIARVPQAIDYTATFNGVPNNGNIEWDVYKTNTVGSMSTVEIDWNLIGNPYPSSINAKKFLEDNTDIEGSVYLWTHNRAATSSESDPFYDDYGINYGDQYVAYNDLGSSNPSGFNGYIASGQAFFVQINAAVRGGSDFNVTFSNDMRYDENEFAHDNSQFYRSSSEETIALEKQLVWLSLANENDKAISTLVGYASGATEGKDRLYDAYTNNEGFNLYSLITEEEKLVIQGLPLPFVDTNTVPLGIELNASGIYKIAIGKVEGNLFVEQEQGIYLEDTYTNVIHDLRTSPYSFTGEAGEFNDRFILRYTPSSTLSISEVSVADTFAYINNATLHLKSSNLIESATVYDMNGKQITNYNVDNRDNSFDTEFRFSKGVYIVAITLDNGTVVTKKLIN
ncbi:T9SS type A sorting domain-containing protein [Winogradskyella psychrotolerans]|uniref:T9SS type A sorting domain-containing protein n=1 Tax=Winogradskyella psychrotolerans TaxID=1344585 RepID=UPI001C0710E6|nr:T9SS type A sorting domain-containing protein [Winogradskyella psychrotolerans]MBU2926827.1 T9SS type A sorting domain-containing protein [Winogradskyella psychrotolerans]